MAAKGKEGVCVCEKEREFGESGEEEDRGEEMMKNGKHSGQIEEEKTGR